MRFPFLVIVTACGSAAPPARAPEPPISSATHSCIEAAIGLERATRGIRAPEGEGFRALRARCISDAWPVATIDCFATMHEDDLGRCSRGMTDRARSTMFEILSGGEADRAGIAVARARLDGLKVGVPECDRFVTAVSNALSCEPMPLGFRIQLGNETAELYSLPTRGLPERDRLEISNACDTSRARLEQEAVRLGCMP